ncbi:MAG: diaminopimelate decarboxylase [Armatimonadetes bacterium]|nr:diaminopimelate decarboxylase [Armatimonadota bacterium]
MFSNLTVNEAGHLVIGGCDVVTLAERFGTPLQILDEGAIRARCRAYHDALRRHCAGAQGYRVLYAGKAFLTTGMCRLVAQEDLCLDVVSGGELATALAAGFSAERIYFHGNNKSVWEIDMGVSAGVSRFVVDSFDEIDRLARAAERAGKSIDVQVRVTPGIKPSTHSYIQTGQLDSKFGFSIGNGMAREAIARVLATAGLELRGLHCHIGSQIHEINAFGAGARSVVALIAEVHRLTGYLPEELNLGGGLGIAYLPEDSPPSVDAYLALLVGAVREAWQPLGAPLPTVLVEPGRSIVGEAGTTLYSIGTIKNIPGVRIYASVDGGMTDNPRAALYQARYHGRLANRMHDPVEEKVAICGKCCETGDMIAWDMPLPSPRRGDLLATFSTGAYHYAMSSNYNRLPRIPIILVHDGEADVLVRGETFDDLIRNDEIPAHLK